MIKARPYWTTRVFVDHAKLYGEVLAGLKPAALPEVRGIRRIFDSEGVPRGGRVIDIACGIGRHIVPIAEAGYRSVGCDLSPSYIAEASKWSRQSGLSEEKLRFYATDYRSLGKTMRKVKEAPFDAAICIFTSMGHYGEEGDLDILRNVGSVVRPGGLFLMEMGNRDWILRNFEPEGVIRAATGLEIGEQRRFDWDTSTVRSTWTFYRSRGRQKRTVLKEEISVRLYSVQELKSLLERAGWQFVRSYGSLTDLKPVSFDSRRLVVVGRRSRTDRAGQRPPIR